LNGAYEELRFSIQQFIALGVDGHRNTPWWPTPAVAEPDKAQRDRPVVS
jgi:hypothetical protein